jgi:hypothetical protein
MEILNKNQRIRSIWRVSILMLAILAILGSVVQALPAEYYWHGVNKLQSEKNKSFKSVQESTQRQSELEVKNRDLMENIKKYKEALDRLKKEYEVVELRARKCDEALKYKVKE